METVAKINRGVALNIAAPADRALKQRKEWISGWPRRTS